MQCLIQILYYIMAESHVEGRLTPQTVDYIEQ